MQKSLLNLSLLRDFVVLLNKENQNPISKIKVCITVIYSKYLLHFKQASKIF